MVLLLADFSWEFPNKSTDSGTVAMIDKRHMTDYAYLMIRSFRHKGLQAFFQKGSKAGIQPSHAARLQLLLTALNIAQKPEQMNAPSWALHKLSGDLGGFWSLRVDGNWRLIFRFEGEDAFDVDYVDYH